MMSGSQTKLISDCLDDDDDGESLSLPDENITSATSLDSLDVGLGQESAEETYMGAAETAMLKKLDTCIEESAPLKKVSHQIKPVVGMGFKPMIVTDVIRDVLYDELSGKVYSLEDAKKWTQTISDILRTNVQGLFERYKILVQVVIGERKGSGCVIGCRCCWDPNTDEFATYQFFNETLFCCAVVFGVYFY